NKSIVELKPFLYFFANRTKLIYETPAVYKHVPDSLATLMSFAGAALIFKETRLNPTTILFPPSLGIEKEEIVANLQALQKRQPQEAVYSKGRKHGDDSE